MAGAEGLLTTMADPLEGEAAPLTTDGPEVPEEEVYVAGAWLVEPAEAAVATQGLDPEAFTDERLRVVVRAAQRLYDAGEPVDVTTIGSELRRTGEIEKAGGHSFLAEVLEAVPSAANVQYHARLLHDRDRRRRIRRLARALDLGASRSDRDLDELLREHEEHLEAIRNGAGPAVRGFPGPRQVAEIMAEPEPDEEWIAEGIVPAGGNVIIAGHPKTFKTFFHLDLAVAAATGTPFLHTYSTGEPRRVGVVLMEGGERRNARRLERLALSRGLTTTDLENVYLWYRPPLRFTDPGVVDGMARWAEELDLDLLTVDAWAYVADGDSNKSDEVTPQLMAFSSIRDRCPGLATSLVQHARKPMGDNKADRLTDLIRNSSAFGAWYDAGFALSRKDEHSPVKVRSEFRDHPPLDPFAFTIEDEEPAYQGNDWTAQGWLRMEVADETPETMDRRSRASRLIPAVVEYLRDHRGASTSSVTSGVTGRARDVREALDLLADQEGRVRREEGARNAVHHYLMEGAE